MDNNQCILDREQVKDLRHMLLIGLASYGEIERLVNAHEVHQLVSDKLPEDLRPLHPTGAADTVSGFATALCHLESASESAQPPEAA